MKSASELLTTYTSTQGSRTIVASAYDICNEFLRAYAETAQAEADKTDNPKARRLNRYVATRLFAVIKHEGEDIGTLKALEPQAKAHIKFRLELANRHLTTDLHTLNTYITARHPLTPTLKRIRSQLREAIAAFDTAISQL